MTTAEVKAVKTENGEAVLTMSFIGNGYEIFEGKYASPGNIKAPVFNWDSFKTKKEEIDGIMYEYPDCDWIRLHNMGQHTVACNRSGMTLNSYGSSFQQSLSVKGKYKLFSGEVSSTFSKTKSELRSNDFASSDYLMEFAAIQMLNPALGEPNWINTEEAKTILSNEFREDLLNEKISPDTLFMKYGTHWISHIVYGGRANLTYSSSIYSSESKDMLQVDATVAYDALVTSISAHSNTEWEKVVSSKSENYSFHCESIGGEAGLIINSPEDWIKTVKDNPAVISFGTPSDSDAMWPIWCFLPSEDPRRKAIEGNYEKWLAKNQVPAAIGEVTVFNYPNFSGRQMSLFVGDYSELNDLGNWSNDIDSIIIPEGLTVTAWSYPNFSQVKYGPYKGPLKINQVYGINDWDSMKIEYSENVAPFVEIFSWPNFDYSNMCASMFEADYRNLSNFNLQNWMNDIDSIIIPEGLKVTAWSYPDFKEKQFGPYVGPKKIPVVDGQNDWDSMKIEKI